MNHATRLLLILITLSVLLPSPSQAQTAEAAKAGLPNFYLGHNLTYAPSPLALRNANDVECGQHLGDAFGMELNFDFRLWYFFIGTHLAFTGDDAWTMGEYAVRVGGFVPLGDRFAIVGAAWLGLARMEQDELYWATEPSMDIPRDESGLLLGASLGLRFMVARWFGLTADMSLSTAMWADAEKAEMDGPTPRLQINRWQAHTGVLFAW